jgi:hypothetical protein
MIPTPKAKLRALIRGLMARIAAGSKKAAQELEGLRRFKELADIIDEEHLARVQRAVRAAGETDEVSHKGLDPADQASQKPETDPNDTQKVSHPDVSVECTQTIQPTTLPAVLSIPPRSAERVVPADPKLSPEELLAVAQQPQSAPPQRQSPHSNDEGTLISAIWPKVERAPAAVRNNVYLNGAVRIPEWPEPGEAFSEFVRRVKRKYDSASAARFRAEEWGSRARSKHDTERRRWGWGYS